MSAWARRASAVTSRTATASTSRSTPGARGSTSASPTHARSAGSPSTRRTPTSRSSPRWDIRSGRIRNADCSAPAMAAWPGRRCCLSTTRPAPSTSSSTRSTRGTCMRRSGRSIGGRGRSTAVDHGSGPYKSVDGGSTWTELKNGLPAGMKGRIGLAVSPTRHDRVWAIVEAKDGGVFRSDNAGVTWQRMNGDSSVRERAWYYSHIIADPKDADTVYVLTLEINKSIDGGRTFQMVRAAHSDNHDLWIAPDDPQRMINGNDGGAAISSNGGRTWTTQQNQPTGQFYHVITDNQFPYRVYGAQQDSSTVSIASRTGWQRDRRDRLVRGRRWRERLHRPGSPRPEHRLCRHVLRHDDAVRSPSRPIAEHLGLARDTWRPSGGRREIPLSMDRADRDLSRGSGGTLRGGQRPLQVDRSGTELAGDQPGSDPQRQDEAGAQRRSADRRQQQRRLLLHDLHRRAIDGWRRTRSGPARTTVSST